MAHLALRLVAGDARHEHGGRLLVEAARDVTDLAKYRRGGRVRD